MKDSNTNKPQDRLNSKKSMPTQFIITLVKTKDKKNLKNSKREAIPYQ